MNKSISATIKIRMIPYAIIIISIIILLSFSLSNASASPFFKDPNIINVNLNSPRALISSLNYLQVNQGNYNVAGDANVTSYYGLINILFNNTSISIFNTSLYPSEFEWQIIYNDSNNTIIIMNLKGSDGYNLIITIDKNQVTGSYVKFNLSEYNCTMAVINYPTFSLAIFLYSGDAITPPPNGESYDIYFAYNHTTEEFYDSGNDIEQEWLNVTIFWTLNQDLEPVFINGWANTTVETSAYIPNTVFNEPEPWDKLNNYFITIHNIYYNTLNTLDTIDDYNVYVGGYAQIWNYSFLPVNIPSDYQLLGGTVWVNVSYLYGEGGVGANAEASVDIPANNL
jgi:hypothetical protein